MDPNDNVGYSLQQVAFALGRHSDQILQERLGIGFAQFKILMILSWQPNIRQRIIADKLGQTEASVSRQIKLMQDGGLLRVSVVPHNRREHTVSLTPKGEKTSQKATRLLNNYYVPIFTKLSNKQLVNLRQSLESINESLG